MLSPREFFGGISVFIDSFTAFMEAEYQMLGAMLAGASDVTAAFTCDSLDNRIRGWGCSPPPRRALPGWCRWPGRARCRWQSPF